MSSRQVSRSCAAPPGASRFGQPWPLPVERCLSLSSCSVLSPRIFQRRSDAWLSGEVEVLDDVAERTPKDALYDEWWERLLNWPARKCQTNCLQTPVRMTRCSSFKPVRWLYEVMVGAGNGVPTLQAIQANSILPNRPTDLRVNGFAVPFRVISLRAEDGGRIYLGLSERDELRVLRSLRLRFILLWLCWFFWDSEIVFFTTRRMLSLIREITEAASRIGHSDLSTRVPQPHEMTR